MYSESAGCKISNYNSTGGIRRIILLIDNYESVSYNVFQLIGRINSDIQVVRNNEITISQIKKLSPSHIIISPGPGKPSAEGICEVVIKYFAGLFHILGFCLGHQTIFYVFGTQLTYAIQLLHGINRIFLIVT